MAAGDVITLIESPVSRKGNYFDGVDDYVLHDAHAVAIVLANDTVGTYTAWIYLDRTPTTGIGDSILSAGDNNLADEFLELFVLTGGKLSVKLNHGGTTQFEIRETTASITARKWTHVAIVQDGTQPKWYVNGKNVATTNTTSTY